MSNLVCIVYIVKNCFNNSYTSPNILQIDFSLVFNVPETRFKSSGVNQNASAGNENDDFKIFRLVRIPAFKYKLGIDSSIKIFRVDAEGDGLRAGMTTLGLILTNSSSVKEWNRIEHHRVSTHDTSCSLCVIDCII